MLSTTTFVFPESSSHFIPGNMENMADDQLNTIVNGEGTGSTNLDTMMVDEREEQGISAEDFNAHHLTMPKANSKNSQDAIRAKAASDAIAELLAANLPDVEPPATLEPAAHAALTTRPKTKPTAPSKPSNAQSKVVKKTGPVRKQTHKPTPSPNLNIYRDLSTSYNGLARATEANDALRVLVARQTKQIAYMRKKLGTDKDKEIEKLRFEVASLTNEVWRLTKQKEGGSGENKENGDDVMID